MRSAIRRLSSVSRGDGALLSPGLVLVGARGNLLPLLGHLQQHPFFKGIVGETGEAHALGGIAAILLRAISTLLIHTRFPRVPRSNSRIIDLVPACAH